LFEIEQMRERALAARVAGAENKGFKEFRSSLDTAITDLRTEVETEKVDVYNLRSEGGASAFFKSAQQLIDQAKKRRD